MTLSSNIGHTVRCRCSVCATQRILMIKAFEQMLFRALATGPIPKKPKKRKRKLSI